MDLSYTEYELLGKTVKWLEKNQSFHICIHDASGITYKNPSMVLPSESKIHSSSFCYCAKSNVSGLRFCLRSKSYSIKKAIKEKKMYISNCYLGITEIVKPVFWKNKLMCVIYLGNLLIEDQRTEVVNRVKRKCSVTGVPVEKLLAKLDTVHSIDREELNEYKEIVNILYNQILMILMQPSTNKISKRTAMHLPINSNNNHWVIDSIQNYVTASYNQNIRLGDLAKIYFLNPQYLCRLFLKETGMHFTEYVNRTRIMHAKRMLSDTKEKIVDISLEAGFNNVSFFNRVFKKYTGLTPSQYRKTNT